MAYLLDALVRRLDETDLELRAALWWYSVDDGPWRLLLAFPGVKQLGSRPFRADLGSAERSSRAS